MTLEELKTKYSIIENIEIEEDCYKVIFILGAVKYFEEVSENDRITNIDEYCSRVENIIKNLK